MDSERPHDPDEAAKPQGDSAQPDPNASADDFAPPAQPCECFCLHCRRTFTSDEIWLQRVRGGREGFDGFWMCPTPNCSGAGFTFDIFPTDPAHPANDGWFHEDEPRAQRDWDWDEDDDAAFDFDDEESELSETGELLDPQASEETWDPSEAHYKFLDEIEDDDDGIEGEEWKYGIKPGELPPAELRGHESDETDEQESEEAKYNQPDRRPREIDAKDWQAREQIDPTSSGGWEEDDIPF